MNVAPHRILIVDDNPDDRFLSQRSLQKAMGGRGTINLVSSGNEAIAYLMGEGSYADRGRCPFPTLLICDLSMQDGDGFDVLEFMQANPGWHIVPRVVFTSSEDDDDIRTAYFLGASVYHLKPATLVEREVCMREIVEYWSTARIAPVDESGRTLATNSTGKMGARYPQPPGGLQMKRPARSRAQGAESPKKDARGKAE